MPTLLSANAIAEQWIYQTLSGDGTLSALVGGRIYSTVAPQTADPNPADAYPMVVFASLTSADVQEFGPLRTMAQALYDISAYDAVPSIVGLDAIMARVDALLQGKQAVTAGGYVLGCRRERTRFTGDPDAGIAYRRSAAVYRIYIEEGHG